MELSVKVARVAFESLAEQAYAKLENKEYVAEKKEIDPRVSEQM